MSDISVSLEYDNLGLCQVSIGGKSFGVFDDIDGDGVYKWFPSRTDHLSGEQIIAIGAALCKVNKQSKEQG